MNGFGFVAQTKKIDSYASSMGLSDMVSLRISIHNYLKSSMSQMKWKISCYRSQLLQLQPFVMLTVAKKYPLRKNI